MKFCYKNGILDWRIVVLVFLLYLLHALTVKILVVASIIAICESGILLFLALKRRLDLYLYTLVIILATTFEFPMFVDESLKFVPSIIMLPLISGYFFLLLSLWPLPKMLGNGSIWKTISKKFPFLFSFVSITLVLGIVMGVLSLFTDSTSKTFHFSFFVKDLMILGVFNVYALYFMYSSLIYPQFKQKLELIIFSVLVAMVLAALFVSLVGAKGFYGTNEIMLMPLSFFFSTTIVFFLFYKKYSNNHFVLLIFLSCITFFMQFAYSNALGGKSWLVFFLILMTCLIFWYKRAKLKLILGSIVVFLLFPFLLNIVEKKTDGDSLSSSKLVQALSLVSVVDVDWYTNLPLSPKIRIEELLNTFLEFVKHPSFALFGKGFGGGHQDYRYAYGGYNPAAFSLEEYNNEYFIRMHESVNTIFLKFGLLGLVLSGTLLFRHCLVCNKSPWLVLGCLWFVFFWGYSSSLMSIGLSSLFIGIEDVRDK